MLTEKSSEILCIDLKRIFCQFSLNKTTLDLKGKSIDPRTPRTWENAYGRVVMGVVPLRYNNLPIHGKKWSVTKQATHQKHSKAEF